MGQATSSTAASAQEERMKTRVRQTIGTFADFATHVKQANEWARLCPTPKTCQLSFRVVLNERLSVELLPYVWKIRGNVHVEVRKLRRRPTTNEGLPITSSSSILGALRPLQTLSSSRQVEQAHATRAPTAPGAASEEAIGHAKLLTVRQFYYIFCFLADIKACAAHTVQFPENDSHENRNPEFDETECQICMDKKKQVVLPCSHSFCLCCFQHWSAQNNTCPICRSKVECSEGSDLFQLMHHEVRDIGSYATDLVARIFEFLEKRDRSQVDEGAIQRSEEMLATASALKCTPLSKLLQTECVVPSYSTSSSSVSRLPLGLSTLLGRVTGPTEVDADFVLALELASGEDQFVAFRQFDQLRRDQVLAMTLAMEVDDTEEDPHEL